MEFAEFVNAWIGFIDAKKQDYAVMFEVARFGAMYNVFSKDQAKALSKTKNPYTDHKPKGRPMMMGEVTGLLSAMARKN